MPRSEKLTEADIHALSKMPDGQVYTFIDSMQVMLQMQERWNMAQRARELKEAIAAHDKEVERIAREVTAECKAELSTTSPSTAAQDAARALYDACLLRDNVVMGPSTTEAGLHYPEQVAAIISKHCCGGREAEISFDDHVLRKVEERKVIGTESGTPIVELAEWERDGLCQKARRFQDLVHEVSRLSSEVERLTELAYVPKILEDDEVVTYRDHAESLLRRNFTARADAIGECVEAAKAEHLPAYGAVDKETRSSDDRSYDQAVNDVVAALEQLKETR